MQNRIEEVELIPVQMPESKAFAFRKREEYREWINGKWVYHYENSPMTKEAVAGIVNARGF